MDSLLALEKESQGVPCELRAHATLEAENTRVHVLIYDPETTTPRLRIAVFEEGRTDRFGVPVAHCSLLLEGGGSR
jgi:hypothetical protein